MNKQLLKKLEKEIQYKILEYQFIDHSNNNTFGVYRRDRRGRIISIDLSFLNLIKFPSTLFEFPSLQYIDLSGNKLSDVPVINNHVSNIVGLKLSSNMFRSAPAGLEYLQNLRNLDLSFNPLEDISNICSKNLPIKNLLLDNCPSLNLTNIVFGLPYLIKLSISMSNISAVPRSIGGLVNLEYLNLSFNNLFELPEEVNLLLNLKEINLCFNNFKKLPYPITKLKNLEILYLSSNNLSTLDDNISQLKNLKQIHLDNNNFCEFPESTIKIKNLEYLNIYSNKIPELPNDLIKLRNLKEMLIHNNPIVRPSPEIVNKSLSYIFKYLTEFKGKIEIVNEAKLLIVGQGDVGKTCLSNRLLFNSFQDQTTTEGIEISKWKILANTSTSDEILLNIWDFGGQEIYHSTHQFFLTKRSIYLLVWNARKSKDYDHVEYWLHTIAAFGGNSPILIVLSKCNERRDDLNMKYLTEKFKNIRGSVDIDSKDGTGIEQLKKMITSEAWNLPHMRTEWPSTWLKIRKILEDSNNNWISNDEYFQICLSNGIDQNDVDLLDRYLHDLGIIIHFADHMSLKNMVILKPEWATEAVYKILDTKSVRNRGGVLKHIELSKIWDKNNYPETIYPQLLTLLEKFELAYELPGCDSHLVPELLPSNEPDFDWEIKDNLVFYYAYDFIPPGIIPRFIVGVNHLLLINLNNNALQWREGALLERDGARALVKLHKSKKIIEIRINGKLNKKRELLAIIRYQFDHINESMSNLKMKQEIPCNCSPNCTTRFDYYELLQGEQMGRKNITCSKTWRDVSLSALLDGYERNEDRIRTYLDPEFNVIQQSQIQNQFKEITEPKNWWYWIVAVIIIPILVAIINIFELPNKKIPKGEIESISQKYKSNELIVTGNLSNVPDKNNIWIMLKVANNKFIPKYKLRNYDREWIISLSVEDDIDLNGSYVLAMVSRELSEDFKILIKEEKNYIPFGSTKDFVLLDVFKNTE